MRRERTWFGLVRLGSSRVTRWRVTTHERQRIREIIEQADSQIICLCFNNLPDNKDEENMELLRMSDFYPSKAMKSSPRPFNWGADLLI